MKCCIFVQLGVPGAVVHSLSDVQEIVPLLFTMTPSRGKVNSFRRHTHVCAHAVTVHVCLRASSALAWTVFILSPIDTSVLFLFPLLRRLFPATSAHPYIRRYILAT